MAKNKRLQQRQSFQPKQTASPPPQSQLKSTSKYGEEQTTPYFPIAPPKHVPLPNIPRLQEFTFEFFMLLFSVMSLGLQYLNLYRTAFWLPHSHTVYAMHFHLIDTGLVYFIVTLLARRIVWSILRSIIIRIFRPTHWTLCLTVARVMFMLVLGCLLLVHFFTMTSQFNLIRSIALFYPFTFYVFKFKLEASAFLEVIPSPIFYAEEKVKYSKSGKKGAGAVLKPIQHVCQNSVEAIRSEVGFLKDDCNRRIAQVIFQTIMMVHYTALVPCIFAPSSLHYDFGWVKVHTVFVGVSTFVWHLIYCFPARYFDILHRSAMHLGGWSKLDSRASQTPFNNWSTSVLWPQGAHVRFAKEYYRAEGYTNAAEPGNSSHTRIYTLFNEPWRAQMVLVFLLMASCLLNLAFVIGLNQWQQILASSFVLAASFAALFILLRDFLILRKVYKFEQVYQSKAN